MREKNAVSKNYLSSPDRFAQLFNAAVFQGNPVIQAEHLRDLDSSGLTFLQHWSLKDPETGSRPLPTQKSKHPTKKHTQKGSVKDIHIREQYRDIIKLYQNQSFLLICGIENQDAPHLAMVLRHMLYDAANYQAQWTALKRRRQTQHDLQKEEFLSGMSASDRLLPVITLCVYWGSDPWTGPRNLHELLDIPEDLAQYKHMIGNYPLNLLEVCRIDNLNQYSGELKALLGFLRYQKDKANLDEFIKHNQDIFQYMTLETAQAIAVLSDARELNQYLQTFEETNNTEKQEEISMCQALTEMIRDGEQRGWEAGRNEGKTEAIKILIEDNLEEQIPHARILEKLQKHFHLTKEEAGQHLKMYC